jgi:hypothetical protein
VSRAPVKYLQLFLTEGAGGGYLGGKAAEPSISSSKATGSNKSIAIADPKFQIVMPDSESMIPNAQFNRAGFGAQRRSQPELKL